MSHSTDDPTDDAGQDHAGGDHAGRAALRQLDEVHLLLGQLACELRKLDESLKVMSVYLDRVASVLPRPPTTH